MKTGKEIFDGMCSRFDPAGETLPPKWKYSDLSPEDKITYLEWSCKVLRDEYNADAQEFQSLLHPLRPHKSHEDCPTYYDGCNCKPDHTQEDWLRLKEENQRLREVSYLVELLAARAKIEELIELNTRYTLKILEMEVDERESE